MCLVILPYLVNQANVCSQISVSTLLQQRAELAINTRITVKKIGVYIISHKNHCSNGFNISQEIK